MERPPGGKRQSESLAGKFESVDFQRIAANDILVGDRALIVTASGNHYILRRSRSNENRLLVYNQREGEFAPGTGRPLGLPEGRQWIAEKGKPFDAYAIDDLEKMIGRNFTSTPVVEIKVLRGLDTWANNKPKDVAGSWGGELAKQLGKIAKGKDPGFGGDD